MDRRREKEKKSRTNTALKTSYRYRKRRKNVYLYMSMCILYYICAIYIYFLPLAYSSTLLAMVQKSRGLLCKGATIFSNVTAGI